MRRIALFALVLSLVVPTVAGAATGAQDPNGTPSPSAGGGGLVTEPNPVVTFGPWFDAVLRALILELGI